MCIRKSSHGGVLFLCAFSPSDAVGCPSRADVHSGCECGGAVHRICAQPVRGDSLPAKRIGAGRRGKKERQEGAQEGRERRKKEKDTFLKKSEKKALQKKPAMII